MRHVAPDQQQYTAERRQIQHSASCAEGTNNDEDWIVLPCSEARERHCPVASSNVYLDFQLRTVFGTFSFNARSTASATCGARAEDDSEHSQQQSPLFQLPVELRLEIYGDLLQGSATESGLKIRQHSPVERERNSLAILGTCRRALAEAEEIFYSSNRLLVEHPGKLWASLSLRRQSAISALTLPVRSPGSALDGLQQLRSFHGLKSLHIQRNTSFRYQDVSSWAIMTPQLVTEIEMMERITEVKIFTPESAPLTEHEVARKKKLEEVDRRVSNAAQNKHR